MKGRKTTPTALKTIRGTDQPCRINSQEPYSEKIIKLPPPPIWFGKLARKIYRSKGSELINMNLLGQIDIDMFLSYCVEYASYLETTEEINKLEYDTILTDENEKVYQRLTKRNASAWERSKTIATQFGFTPSSRASLKLQPQQKQDDFEKFLS